MFSAGTRDNPPYQGNFIERLYEKKLSLLAESKLTLLSYSLLKSPDIFLRLSWFNSISVGFVEFILLLYHKFVLEILKFENTWLSARRELSQVVEYMTKSCPACQVTLPAETRLLSHPSCLALDTTRAARLTVGGIFQRFYCKVSSPRVTQGEGCLGYPRPYKQGLILLHVRE